MSTTHAIDQRTEPRQALPKDCRATLSVLNGAKQSIQETVTVINLSGSGMRIRAPRAIAAGTLVRIDLNETLMLGEVCYAEPDGDGFSLGLRLEHSLRLTESLERLRQRVAEGEIDWAYSPSR